MSKLSKTDISDFDKWIEQLKNCQPLEESQVKVLCEKVIQIILIYSLNIGKRNIKYRAKCSTSESSSNSVWRYTWSIF
jgi:hypothetical protein